MDQSKQPVHGPVRRVPAWNFLGAAAEGQSRDVKRGRGDVMDGDSEKLPARRPERSLLLRKETLNNAFSF